MGNLSFKFKAVDWNAMDSPALELRWPSEIRALIFTWTTMKSLNNKGISLSVYIYPGLCSLYVPGWVRMGTAGHGLSRVLDANWVAIQLWIVRKERERKEKITKRLSTIPLSLKPWKEAILKWLVVMENRLMILQISQTMKKWYIYF